MSALVEVFILLDRDKAAHVAAEHSLYKPAMADKHQDEGDCGSKEDRRKGR
jgi:hypothetical protein